MPNSDTSAPEVTSSTEPEAVPESPESSIPGTPPATGFPGTDVPPEAPEAPRDEATQSPVKDANPEPKPSRNAPADEAEQPNEITVIAAATAPNFIRDLLARARAKIQERKGKKLAKIIGVFNTKTKITNDDVQKLLRVSGTTATRYLNILEQQGKIKQSEKAGKYTFYTKI